MGEELLAPRPRFPGPSLQVPPVQSRCCTVPSFLGFKLFPGGPVLSLREALGEASFRGTVLSPPQGPLLQPEPGAPSLDLLCDLRQAARPL